MDEAVEHLADRRRSIGSSDVVHSVFMYSTSASLSVEDNDVPNSCPSFPLAFCETSRRVPMRSASGPAVMKPPLTGS
jgi:hypothetical protein